MCKKYTQFTMRERYTIEYLMQEEKTQKIIEL